MKRFWLAVACALKGCKQPQSDEIKSFVEIDEILVTNPPSGRFDATLIYLHGMSGQAVDHLAVMRDLKFFDTIEDHVRVVAPQVKRTLINPEVEWFPFLVRSWEYYPEPRALALETDLIETVQVLQPIIDEEAGRLGGNYSKIFLFGYSKGGMIGSYLALAGNMSFGGLIMHASAFSLLVVAPFPEIGRNIPLYHCHDVVDTGVLYSYAKTGMDTAVRAGARNYQMVNVTMSGQGHHAFSEESLAGARTWLMSLF